MFAEKNLDKPMTRRDYINLRSSEEYARRESSLFRRVWRFLRQWPGVVNINARMAAAHARDLFEITAALKRKKDDEAKLARERAGTVMLQENAKAKEDEK
jgi:hypothetical protein